MNKIVSLVSLSLFVIAANVQGAEASPRSLAAAGQARQAGLPLATAQFKKELAQKAKKIVANGQYAPCILCQEPCDPKDPVKENAVPPCKTSRKKHKAGKGNKIKNNYCAHPICTDCFQTAVINGSLSTDESDEMHCPVCKQQYSVEALDYIDEKTKFGVEYIYSLTREKRKQANLEEMNAEMEAEAQGDAEELEDNDLLERLQALEDRVGISRRVLTPRIRQEESLAKEFEVFGSIVYEDSSIVGSVCSFIFAPIQLVIAMQKHAKNLTKQRWNRLSKRIIKHIN